MMKLVRYLDDGHAKILWPEGDKVLSRMLPVDLFLFTEGLYVIGAAPDCVHLLGARVDKIGGLAIGEVMAALDPIMTRDNEQWVTLRFPVLVRYTAILEGLGIDEVLTVKLADGTTDEVRLEATPADLRARYWDSYPAGWVALPDTVTTDGEVAVPRPLHLRNRELPFWFEYLPGDGLFYFQFNAVRNHPAETFTDFCDRLFGFIEVQQVGRLVIDVRWNGGGNTLLSQHLLHHLIASKRLSRRGAGRDPRHPRARARLSCSTSVMKWRALIVRATVPDMVPEPRIVKVGSRDLAVEDAGPGTGFPVLMMNGAGSRHLFPPAVRDGREQGFRLIGYDRPGCGRSTSLPGRRIADCAEDIRAILGDLGISRTAVWGSSGGGPYALAAASGLPEMVAAVCVFASVAPYGEPDLDWTEGLGGDQAREEIRQIFDEPKRARADFRARSAITLAERGSADWWLQHWGERAGQDAAHSREWAEYLALCTCDALRAGDDGTFDDEGSWEDDNAIYHPWQFDLGDIQAPVSIWHGLQDFLPVSHARWLADRISNVDTHFLPDEDHSNLEENNRAAAFAWLKGLV